MAKKKDDKNKPVRVTVDIPEDIVSYCKKNKISSANMQGIFKYILTYDVFLYDSAEFFERMIDEHRDSLEDEGLIKSENDDDDDDDE